jgi:AmpD protein
MTDGWLALPGMTRAPSPNCNARDHGTVIDLLVIHNISLPPGEFDTGLVKDLFLNQIDISIHPWLENVGGLKVSSHFLIERNGQLTQFVSCDDRAWHAGVSTFDGRQACNDFSIGIELEGTDDLPFTTAQYEALNTLTLELRAHYPLSHVRGHSDIASGRKTDPGRCFDWAGYAKGAGWPVRALPAQAQTNTAKSTPPPTA